MGPRSARGGQGTAEHLTKPTSSAWVILLVHPQRDERVEIVEITGEVRFLTGDDAEAAEDLIGCYVAGGAIGYVHIAGAVRACR